MDKNTPLEEILRRTAYQPDRVPFPDRLVSCLDIAKGVGEVIFHSITDQFLHETPSEHFLPDGSVLMEISDGNLTKPDHTTL